MAYNTGFFHIQNDNLKLRKKIDIMESFETKKGLRRCYAMSREGDVVLIHIKEQPTIYARIEAIEPDIKKGWYRVTLLLLSIPQQVITWILREEYINGAPFTMDGNPIMMQEIKRSPFPSQVSKEGPTGGEKTDGSSKGKVVPFKAKPK